VVDSSSSTSRAREPLIRHAGRAADLGSHEAVLLVSNAGTATAVGRHSDENSNRLPGYVV
jgi:hypothetical protein